MNPINLFNCFPVDETDFQTVEFLDSYSIYISMIFWGGGSENKL